MKKRILSLFAALCLLLTLAPAAHADLSLMHLTDGMTLSSGDPGGWGIGYQSGEDRTIFWESYVDPSESGWWAFDVSPRLPSGSFFSIYSHDYLSEAPSFDDVLKWGTDGRFYAQLEGYLYPDSTLAYRIQFQLATPEDYVVTAHYLGTEAPRVLSAISIDTHFSWAREETLVQGPAYAFPGETVTFTVITAAGEPVTRILRNTYTSYDEKQDTTELLESPDGVYTFVMPQCVGMGLHPVDYTEYDTEWGEDSGEDLIYQPSSDAVTVSGVSLEVGDYATTDADGNVTKVTSADNWNIGLTYESETGYILTLRNAILADTEDNYALNFYFFTGRVVLEGENRLLGDIAVSGSPTTTVFQGPGSLCAEGGYLDIVVLESGSLRFARRVQLDSLIIQGGSLACDQWGLTVGDRFEMTGGALVTRADPRCETAFVLRSSKENFVLGPNAEIKYPVGGQAFDGEFMFGSVFADAPDQNYERSGTQTMIVSGGETSLVSHVETEYYEEDKETYTCSIVDNAAKVVVIGEKGKSVPSWLGDIPAIAYASTQPVDLDGAKIELPAYALKDESGNDTNYIKLRDLAALLNGAAAQFEVGWDGAVNITPRTPYTVVGGEGSVPFSGDRDFTAATAETRVSGVTADLTAILLTDDEGGGYTYYKLRNLGQALGFNVGWSADKGIFLETDKPYDPAN